MVERAILPLSPSITRGLTDKLVERRKAAALELERLVKDLLMMNDYGQVKQVISALERDFTVSSNPNSRKGGLVGLAATAIALGRPSIGMHLPELVQPVLMCFEDQDPRVRYYACESLYNISKVARSAVLVFFNNIFEGLCKLSCDADSNVRYGAELLDRLMKDVVSENPHFDTDNFILLLRERIYTKDGFARQFLVSWISFLDSVPDIHMSEHVPEFIDGLFCILGDQRKEIRRMAEEALGELLKEIEQYSSSVRFEAMTNVIAIHSQSDDAVIQFTALTWLKTFLDLAQRSMMVFTANILISILPCVAYEDPEKAHIRNVSLEVNDRLKKLILPEDDEDEATDLATGEGTSLTKTSQSSPRLSPKFDTTSSTTASSSATVSTGHSSPRLSPKSAATSHSASASTETSTASSKNGLSSSRSPSELHPSSSVELSGTGGINRKISIREPPKLHLLAVLGVLIPHTKYTLQETRLETLQWLMWLHRQLPKRVYRQAEKLFPALLEMVTDLSDRVVRMALQVIATLSTSRAGLELESSSSSSSSSSSKAVSKSATPTPTPHPPLNKYFRMLLLELLKMFDSNKTLLERKGSFIIRHLCLCVDAHSVYCTLAEILYAEENLQFASMMVQVLNMILFTTTELYELRVQLKDLKTPESWHLFTTLYSSWCHNPVATVSLCLLSQNYDHASNLVQKFADIEITADLLKEIDSLVQLIESPIFAFLRLQLLAPQEHVSLVRTLYGLLMLLPQSGAFSSLKQRLSCVPVITIIDKEGKSKRTQKPTTPSTIGFGELLEHFVAVQRKHSAARRKAAIPNSLRADYTGLK